LVRRPAAIAVVIAIVAPPAPAVVAVARAVVAVVFNALSLPLGFYGVAGVMVGPELTPEGRCRGSDSLPASLLLEGGGFRPRADGALARPRSERYRKAELSACCATAASSSAFNCWRTRLSSEVAGSG
jgi:hypothetical protein